MPTAKILTREEHINRLHNTVILAMRLHKRYFMQRLQSFGLTIPQFITVAALAAHKQACTMRDLTNVTFQDPPTATGIVDRLVKMDLAQRTRSQTDRRVVLVEPTQAGIDMIERINAELSAEAINIYSGLADDQLQLFEGLLKHFVRAFIQHCNPIEDADIDTEIKKLENFVNDPIQFVKLGDENAV